MKTGMNLLLWTTHVTSELYPTLGKIKAAGFDGVEVPIFGGDVAHYKALGAELKNLGLRSTAVTVVSPEANPISPDAKVRQSAVDRLKEVIECVAAHGGENLCGPFHSPLGVFSGNGPTADEKKHAADTLRKVAEFAATAKVQLAIEYLNRFECYFLTTAADAISLVNAVNHPSFGCMYDSFHAHIEEKEQASAIRTVAKGLRHVHVSENDRGIPGTGQVRWAEYFKTLKEVGYDGWMVIESFGRALPDLAAATKVWRDLFPKAEDVYTKGLAFIREQWGK